MDERFTISILSRVADVIADTSAGLSGKKIISYCNAFAVDYNVRIPHAIYPFQASSKRTALFENLRTFTPHIQYRLIMELCADKDIQENKDVKAVRLLIQERYAHLASENSTHALSVPTWAPLQLAIPPSPPPPSTNPAPELPAEPYDIFLSYSHEDEALVNLVRQHLVLYDRLNQIRKWWDRKLLPGTTIDKDIANTLARSDIILLFVSASFMDSDYCYNVEMKQALSQHSSGRSQVVPVILRHCGWRGAPFSHLLALPRDGRPPTDWPDRDEGAKNIADGVMRIVSDLQRRMHNAMPYA